MSTVMGWAVIVGSGPNPSYYFWDETPDRAVQKAKTEAHARGVFCSVAKIIETHLVTPPMCKCQPEVQDVE
jgi:hypothetical protein